MSPIAADLESVFLALTGDDAVIDADFGRGGAAAATTTARVQA